jgi:C-terminal processing protease CtpA/Prc
MLAGCGGGGGGGSSGGATGSVPTPTPTTSPTLTTTAGCSLRERQDWAAAQLREWYLFPETLPANLDPSPFTTVDSYIDALTATARNQQRDRFFTYLTSIAEENAFFNSGATAGFGFRLTLDSARTRIIVSESFEGTPALTAGIDRGTQIVGIGTTTGNVRTIGAIDATGPNALTEALGPDTPGTSRVFRIQDGAATRDVTVAKADYELTPVSSRYGAQVIDDGGRKVGYVNLRTFINTADAPLRQAFANFRAQGIGEVIVDFRYNGGGLISIAELMGDLLGRNRSTSDVFSYTVFRPEKANNNSTRFFRPLDQSIAPTKIAFIGTRGTASASELVINAFVPYLRNNVALVGTNTFGKPVGQIALDRAACDDRLRVVALATQNAERRGDYYTGLASTVGATCAAGDDLTRPLGNPQEASTRAALDFLAGRTCSPITGSGGEARALSAPRELLSPERPSTAQRDTPGLF